MDIATFGANLNMAGEHAGLDQLESFLRNHDSVQYIRFQWVDYAGILRVRILTIAYCRRLAATSSPLAMTPLALTSTTINEFMPDLVATGVDYIYPDYRS